MKTLQSLMSIGLGFLLAWAILTYVPVQQPKVSYYTMNPWPLELDDSNLAIIGVGLATAKPKPSVMDATPAPMAKPVMMASAPGSKTMAPAPGPKPMMMAQSPAQPMMMMPSPSPSSSMMSMSPVSIMPSPSS